jgi:hypothetical protein
MQIPSSTTQLSNAIRTADAVSAASGSTQVAINVGGSGVSNWLTDTDYSGGWVYKADNTIDTSLVSNPAPQQVYQTNRTGVAFSYTIPSLTARAAYTVRLHFAELWETSAGQREFDVTINDQQVLSNFDVFRVAGGRNYPRIEFVDAYTDNDAFPRAKRGRGMAGSRLGTVQWRPADR